MTFTKGHKYFSPKTEEANQRKIDPLSLGPKFLKGQTSPRKGIKLSDDTKKKISDSRRGKVFTKSHIENLRKAMVGNKNSLGYKQTENHIRKALARREKSSLELKFEEIVARLNLPYKFVGNGDFFIERKNPDFINTNGKKIAVEVFYRRHKDMFTAKFGGFNDWKNERQEIFNKYGWKIVFLDETQVNEKTIQEQIGEDKI